MMRLGFAYFIENDETVFQLVICDKYKKLIKS